MTADGASRAAVAPVHRLKPALWMKQVADFANLEKSRTETAAAPPTLVSPPQEVNGVVSLAGPARTVRMAAKTA